MTTPVLKRRTICVVAATQTDDARRCNPWAAPCSRRIRRLNDRRRKMDTTTLGHDLMTPALWAGAVAVLLILLRASNVFRYISNNQVGIVEKLWTTKGSISEGFIALNGEAGYEPEVLRGGLHVFFPFMYRIHKSDLVTVGQGKIAYVFARPLSPLGALQVLGANDTEDRADFQDVRRFLLGGGQKGPQRKIL